MCQPRLVEKKKKKNYTLSRKKNGLNNIMFGALGSISYNNFYIGTQIGSKLGNFYLSEFFIHTFKLKIQTPRVSPSVLLLIKAMACISKCTAIVIIQI